jgi:hypothetical protein
MKIIEYNGSNALVDSFVRIASEMQDKCRRCDGDLAVAEAALGRALDDLRGILPFEALESASQSCGRDYRCLECKRALTPWGKRKRQVVTAHGEGVLRAERLRCRRCGTDVYPLLIRNAMVDTRFTLGARRVIAEEAANMPYASSSRHLKRIGIAVSASQADQIAQQVATWRKEEEEAVRAVAILKGQDLNLPLHDKRKWDRHPADTALVVSVDGAMVRSTTPGEHGLGLEWFETRVGVLTLNCDYAPKAIVAGFQDADKLFETLWSQSRQIGGKRKAVFIADGAAWIWDRAAQFFPKAVQVLDIYHAAEHVAAAARACWGAESAEALQWARTARNLLMQPSGVRTVLRQLCRRLRSGGCADTHELQTQIRYLWKNRRRMHYDRLLDQRLPIGSGVMESAIKQTTTQRLRQPGMKWTRDTAALIMRLRASFLSGSLELTVHRQSAIAFNTLKAYAIAV